MINITMEFDIIVLIHLINDKLVMINNIIAIDIRYNCDHEYSWFKSW